jgi:hypothetical protein
MIRPFANRFQLTKYCILNASDEQFVHHCRHSNDKPIALSVVIIPARAPSLATSSDALEHTHRILSLTYPDSASSRPSWRSILSYSPCASWNSVHGL